jgi:phage portal protein BeeE
MNFISYSAGLLGNLFSGKDQFTQSNYPIVNRQIIGNDEIWIDNSIGNRDILVKTVPELSIVIGRKASMMSSGVWKHLKADGSEVEKSKYVDLLNNPNVAQNGGEFVRQTSIMKSIHGNAFNYMLDGGMSDLPQAIWCLPSDRMVIKFTGNIYKQNDINEIIESYRLINEDGKYETYESDKIVHFVANNIDNPILGQSPLTSLTMPISNIKGGYGFRNRIITNNAALGILSSNMGTDGMGIPLDSDEQKRLNEGYAGTFGMQKGKSNLLMTSANVNYTPVSYPTKDLMLFEEIDVNFKRIIDEFGLNKNIFSMDGDSKFSNLQEGLKMAYQDTIIPESKEMAETYTKHLNMPNGEYLVRDFSHIPVLKQDEKENSEINKRNAETYAILKANGREDLANDIYE